MTLIRRHRVGAHTLERAVEEATGIKGVHQTANQTQCFFRSACSRVGRGGPSVHCLAALPHARVPGGSRDARGL